MSLLLHGFSGLTTLTHPQAARTMVMNFGSPSVRMCSWMMRLQLKISLGVCMGYYVVMYPAIHGISFQLHGVCWSSGWNPAIINTETTNGLKNTSHVQNRIIRDSFWIYIYPSPNNQRFFPRAPRGNMLQPPSH